MSNQFDAYYFIVFIPMKCQYIYIIFFIQNMYSSCTIFIPQGIKGMIGPPGLVGPTGQYGPQGPRGEKGTIGPMGLSVRNAFTLFI